MIGRLLLLFLAGKNHLAVEFGNMRRHMLSAGYGNSQKKIKALKSLIGNRKMKSLLRPQ